MGQNIREDHERLLDNLKIIQKLFTAKALSEALGITQNTWTNRMREPWARFSYDDFKMISKVTAISFKEITEGSVKIQ